MTIATGVYYMATFGTALIKPEQMTRAQIVVLGGGFLLGIITQALGLLPYFVAERATAIEVREVRIP